MEEKLNQTKKIKLPNLKSLRPPLFRVDLFWYLALTLFAVILVITGTIGFRLFYDGYFESYRQEIVIGSLKDPINITHLQKAVETRQDFVGEEITFPRDPSL